MEDPAVLRVQRAQQATLEIERALAVEFPSEYEYPGANDKIERSSRTHTFEAFFHQSQIIRDQLQDILELKDHLTDALEFDDLLTLHSLSVQCQDILAEWHDIGGVNFHGAVDQLTKQGRYQNRQEVLYRLRDISRTLKDFHRDKTLPLDKDKLAREIGQLAIEHFKSLDEKTEADELIKITRYHIEKLTSVNNESRKLLQTKEIKSIGKEYRNSKRWKVLSFWLAFTAAMAALIGTPLIVDAFAISRGIKDGILGEETPALLPVTASITLIISGMLFKLAWNLFQEKAWNLFQEKAVLESRHKLCLVLLDFLDNFKDDIDRGEIVRMIAYSLFMDNNSNSSSLTEGSHD